MVYFIVDIAFCVCTIIDYSCMIILWGGGGVMSQACLVMLFGLIFNIFVRVSIIVCTEGIEGIVLIMILYGVKCS